MQAKAHMKAEAEQRKVVKRQEAEAQQQLAAVMGTAFNKKINVPSTGNAVKVGGLFSSCLFLCTQIMPL